MSALYIDYTHSIPVGQTKIHGGGNYTRTLLINLLNYLKQNKIRKKIIVLWPKGYLPNSAIEQQIYNNDYFEIKHIDELNKSVEFEINSTLFIPLLGMKNFKVLKIFKRKKINIIVTIHGLRLLDYKFDIYNLKYAQKIQKMIVLCQEILLPLKKFIYKYTLKKYLKYIDTIITVSNYTLAELAKLYTINDVLLQFEDTKLESNLSKINCSPKGKDFILFVNGNRPEKNLARTIDAYKLYVKNNNIIPLYIVGSSKQTKNALIKNLDLHENVYKENIVFLDYVSDDELTALYSNALFLLYTSKSEGFGLPALEAMKYKCPVVSAYGTSIPEILGTNCVYVNPYSVYSIKNGIMQMMNANIRNSIKSKLETAYENLIPKIQDSNNAVIKKIIQDG